MRARWAGGVAVAVCGLALVGCGSTGHPATTSATPTCAATQLAAGPYRPRAAAGHVGAIVRLTNTSSTTCQLRGFPDLEMLGPDRAKVPTEVIDGVSYTVPSVTVRTVRLAPLATAEFYLGYTDATGFGTDVCPTSTQLRIYPPGGRQPIVIDWSAAVYGGTDIAHLHCGQITVSPVFASP